jgi:sodium-dependent dicarboxylate transporter 2/3/5
LTSPSQDQPAALRPGTGIALSIALAALVLLLPRPEGLSPEGQRLGALFALAIGLWVTEALPVGVTALLVLVLQPLGRVADMGTAFQGFASPVFFFVLAMLFLAQAVIGAGLDRRFAFWLLDRAGSDSRRVVIALIVGSSAVSTIMSDVPACAIFMTIGLGVLTRAGAEPGTSRFGKAVMVGIPIGSLIGGVATPAGSSINVLGMHFLEEHGGVTVSFLEWTAIGVPMALVLTPLACWVVLRFFPPELERVPGHDQIAAERAQLGPLTLPEKKAIALVSTMLVLWVAGNWVPQLNVVMVALIGSIAMFLPGVDLLRWRELQPRLAWDVLLLIGGVTSIAAASVETGLAEWLVTGVLGGMQAWSPVAAVAAISAFTVLVHLVVPIGPVINALLIPPIVLLAREAGVNPAVYALPVAFSASASFLLPIDPVPLLTYSKGYYRMLDMLVPGLVLGALWVVWLTVLVVGLAPRLGLG